jgi:hypothetical protein
MHKKIEIKYKADFDCIRIHKVDTSEATLPTPQLHTRDRMMSTTASSDDEELGAFQIGSHTSSTLTD